MIIGVISDTHSIESNALPHIMKRFKDAGVKVVIHCGDLDKKHLSPKLFANFPIICALTEDQIDDAAFAKVPEGWRFTRPGDRICDIGDLRVYVGHKRSFDFLTGSEAELIKVLNALRRDHDRVSWLFSGHTHHQIFYQSRTINFLNPGAVENSIDGHEFAIIDTENWRTIFSRIPEAIPQRPQFQIGIISDSLNVSELDVDFWKRLATALRIQNVKYIIHCGNIALSDIGRPELKDFSVYFSLRLDQEYGDRLPENWYLIPLDQPIVEIEGYRFYIQLDLGLTLIKQSEFDMYTLSLELRRKHPEITFALCGFTYGAFYEEGEQVRIINPGDVVKDRNFAVIGLPTTEVTFDNVLPALLSLNE